MMSYLICNIGNHDVQLASEVIIEEAPVGPVIPKNLVRRAGELILNELSRYEPLLCFPLLEPILEYLKEDALREVIMFVTDQVDEKHRQQDTVFFGRIIKECLLKRSWRHGQPKITIQSINLNPADYDDMNLWYRERFRRLREKFAPETVYLALAGGTPAMNTFTLLHGVGFFGSRAEALYSKPGDRRPVPLRVGQDLVVQRIKDEILSLINSYDYYAARDRAESLAGETGRSDGCTILGLLLGYAHARLSFDFDAALREIDQAIQRARGRQRQVLEELRSDLYHGGPRDLLGELVADIRVKALRGEFIDMLARIFRFQEAAYQLALEDLGVEFEDQSKKKLNPDWLDGNITLRRYLDHCSVEGAPLDYRRSVNRRVMDAILRYYAEQINQDPARTIRPLLARIERLGDLRNRTPTAHGFQGVSRKTVEECFGASVDELLRELEQVAAAIAGDIGARRPFHEKVNALAGELIAQLE